MTSTPGTAAGNVILGNATGISDTGGGDDLILGNLVGTNAAGTAAVGNTADGIDVDASGDTIGGSTASARNVISGNAAGGIDLSAPGIAVEGNYVGVGITDIISSGTTLTESSSRVATHNRRADRDAGLRLATSFRATTSRV